MTYFIFFLSMGVALYLTILFLFKNVTQYEREEGLKQHKSKAGTITMGGILFVIPNICFLITNIEEYFILLAPVLFYIIGLIDDSTKVFNKNNMGLSAKNKLLLQIVFSIACGFMYYATTNKEFNILYFLIVTLAFISSSNAYNLTDGCDGLLTLLSLVLGVGYLIIILSENDMTALYYHLSIMGLLCAFLIFNLPKAYIFMGDVGSLFLGAYFCSLAIKYDIIFIYLIMNGVVIFETLSVIIQVTYFKLTHGKRVFKMSPFHHHLEANNKSEIMVDLILVLVQMLLVIVGIYVGGYLN